MDVSGDVGCSADAGEPITVSRCRRVCVCLHSHCLLRERWLRTEWFYSGFSPSHSCHRRRNVTVTGLRDDFTEWEFHFRSDLLISQNERHLSSVPKPSQLYSKAASELQWSLKSDWFGTAANINSVPYGIEKEKTTVWYFNNISYTEWLKQKVDKYSHKRFIRNKNNKCKIYI